MSFWNVKKMWYRHVFKLLTCDLFISLEIDILIFKNDMTLASNNSHVVQIGNFCTISFLYLAKVWFHFPFKLCYFCLRYVVTGMSETSSHKWVYLTHAVSKLISIQIRKPKFPFILFNVFVLFNTVQYYTIQSCR